MKIIYKLAAFLSVLLFIISCNKKEKSLIPFKILNETNETIITLEESGLISVLGDKVGTLNSNEIITNLENDTLAILKPDGSLLIHGEASPVSISSNGIIKSNTPKALRWNEEGVMNLSDDTFAKITPNEKLNYTNASLLLAIYLMLDATPTAVNTIGILEVKELINGMGKELIMGQTTGAQLQKMYKVEGPDEYKNYRLKKSFEDKYYSLKWTYSFYEEDKLSYITLACKAEDEMVTTNADGILKYLTETLGDPKIISENEPDRYDWQASNYNIVFWHKTDWDFNIEPKDYDPGY